VYNEMYEEDDMDYYEPASQRVGRMRPIFPLTFASTRHLDFTSKKAPLVDGGSGQCQVIPIARDAPLILEPSPQLTRDANRAGMNGDHGGEGDGALRRRE
jgi:hypothetical protein